MSKRMLIITVALCLAAFAAGFGFAAYRTVSNEPTFASDGYVLGQDGLSVKKVPFSADNRYKVTNSGTASFTSDGDKVTVPSQSFAFLDDGSVMAMNNGILLDFNDLSDNFINHYYISARLPITRNGNTYSAQTSSGNINFGEHMWKLSDQKYLIESPALTVAFSEDDKRGVDDYVEINITDDGIVQILTEDNMWMTISDSCYIETAGGVRVYPVSLIIDNDNYKLSMAKLSVSPEDSIVLTESETRRQIIPQFNIETIDGENGVDGGEGQIGQTGNEGGAGIKGDTGKNGEDGGKGDDGKSGEDGQKGTVGTTGSTGSTGDSGAGGSDGKGGSSGKRGNDAVVASSTNTALPTLSFNEWDVTATSLRGSIAIVDENDYLRPFDGDDNHPATVTITEVATGETVVCYQIDPGEEPVPETDPTVFNDIYAGGEQVYFATVSSALKPDTLYNVSVKAFYKVNETAFSREFITRNFYTDSAGVFLSKKDTTQSTLDVNVSVASDYKDTINTANVFLLTPIQNQTFNAAEAAGTNWAYKVTMDYKNKKIQLWSGGADSKIIEERGFKGDDIMQEIVNFYRLPSDTRYIGRVLVNAGAMNVLTNQELDLKTLKTAPTWAADDKPKVSYNRVSGGFEVYRPKVRDVDGGAVDYVYNAYDASGAVVVSRKLAAGEAEPAVFFLPTGADYIFGVTLDFNDNEKEVVYDLGKSETVRAMGSTMPKVTITEREKDYNKFLGDIIITLASADNKLEVSPSKPLELNIYADQVYDSTIVLKDGNPVIKKDASGQKLYEVTYIPPSAASSNEHRISMDMYNLYKNTNYTVTLTGYLDVNDVGGDDPGTSADENAVKRVIGIASFHTQDTLLLRANFDKNAGATTTMSVNLTLEPVLDGGEDEKRGAYAVTQLEKGKIKLELFHGTGYGVTLLSFTEISEEADLAAIYGETGLTVTEETFSSPPMQASSDYTLRVSLVSDQTYEMKEISYLNTFDFVNVPTTTVVAQATPPDLLQNPALGVAATPIQNKVAGDYGGVYNKELPDGAIVGYALEAKYDNSQRLGLSVTYYAMEYKEFYNAMTAGVNPVKEDSVTKLMETTLQVNSTEDTVPKVVYLFGGTKDVDPVYKSGYYVYHTGEAVPVGGQLTTGMGRGYRYAFAYTVRYSTSGGTEGEDTKTYPDDHPRYDAFKNEFGIGTVFGFGADTYGPLIGKGKTYVLNSGLCEAPRVQPKLYSYANATTGITFTGDNSPSSANVEIYYTHRDDVDGTIKTSSTERTMISYPVPNSPEMAQVGYGLDEVDNGWYKMSVNYQVTRDSNEVISPIVNISTYELDYTDIMNALRAAMPEIPDDTVYLCHIPVEWAWGEYFKAHSTNVTALINASDDFLQKNYIQVRLDEQAGGQLKTYLAERAFVLKLTLMPGLPTDDTKPDTSRKEIFYLPIQVEEFTNVCYVNLATGLLKENYLKKRIYVEAEVLYDTGAQGWSLLDGAVTSGNYFGMQYTNDSDGNAGYSNYIVASTASRSVTTSQKPRGGLLKVGSSVTSGFMSDFRAIAGEKETSKSFNYISEYMTGDYVNTFRYVSPSFNGVDSSANSTLQSGTGVVLKQAGSYPLSMSTNYFVLSKVTPTIEYGGYTPASDKLQIKSFLVRGRDTVDPSDPTVHVALFDGDKQQDAQELKIVEGVTPILNLTLNEDGRFIASEEEVEAGKAFLNLQKDTKYYLVFYMTLVDELGNKKNTILIDSSTVEAAVYSAKTTTGVDIESEEGLIFGENNHSYFDKRMELKFSLNRYYGVSLEYDFYTNASTAEAPEGATPLLSHSEMVNSGLIKPPRNYSLTNRIDFNMEPSPNRAKLQPGGTYYLRVTAYETTGGSRKEVGHSVYPVTIPPVGFVDAYVRLTDARSDQLNFQVTLSDEQYSVMGCGKLGAEGYDEGAGLYAIRFTYEAVNDSGNKVEYRLPTKYDSLIFSEAVPQRSFVLDDAALSNPVQHIKPETQYTMKVYAIVDTEHTGRSASVTGSAGGEKDWHYFFDPIGTAKPWGTDEYRTAPGFNDFIDTFWHVGNNENEPGMDGIEAGFLIATRTASTTGESGVHFNPDDAIVVRGPNSGLRLLLPESFGIIGSDGQLFKKIEWDIKGETTAYTPPRAVRITGTNLSSEASEHMFQQSEAGASYNYYYDFYNTDNSRLQLGKGTYTVVIQLYYSEKGTEHETLSLRFYEN